MKPREYQWDAEEPLADTPVRVTAHVWGRDTPARGPSYASGGSPAEPREVEITVERWVGQEWEDVTVAYAAWLDTLEEQAIEMDDDAEEYARERASERGES